MNPPTQSSPEQAEAELDRRSIAGFISARSTGYERPEHLSPLLERFERALRGEPQRVCCHAPPRHGKTESVLHVPAFALLHEPWLRFGYCTYGDRLSRSKSRRARAIAVSAGVELESTSLNEWRTPAGGGMLAQGVGGPLTGHGLDVLIVDDPVKNRIEAESATYRDRLFDWWRDVARTRIEPGGSAFVFATRWHQDDLIGRLVSEGYEYLQLSAIDDSGSALWPSRWPIESLEALREDVGPYTWASLFQGDPRPRGGSVFDGVHTYEVLPAEFRESVGLDLSYSAKTSSDYSVAVSMRRSGDRFYITDMRRRQCRAPEFLAVCTQFRASRPSASWRWYASGTETGTADFFRGLGIPVSARVPHGDKFVRAVKYSAAWAAGRVLLPKSAPWLDALVSEHMNFTGLKDKHDDIIDACVAAFDELDQTSSASIRTRPMRSVATGLAAMDI